MPAFRWITAILITWSLLCACDSNAPPVISEQTFTVWEGWHYYWDPEIKAYDPDGDPNLTFTIIDGNEEGIFALFPTTGVLSVVRSDLIDYERKPVHLLKVAVSDNHKRNPLEASAWIRIEVRDDMEFTDGMVAYYSFNVDARDLSNYQQHGIINGAQLVEGRDEESQNAMLLDGSDDYIRFPDRGKFSFPKGHLSMSLWVQAREHRDTTYLISKGAGESDREYALGINSDSLFFFRIYDRGNHEVFVEAKSSTRVNYSDWYQVGANWDGYILYLYVNGEQERSLYCNVTPANYGADLYAGSAGESNPQTSLMGAVDDLIIFNRDLRPHTFSRMYLWPFTEWFPN